MVSKAKFNRFLELLEVHENLLHAETQAIAARDLDTVESILVKKDESLRDLLESKDELGSNPIFDKDSEQGIAKVLDLQERNANSFAKLHKDISLSKKGKMDLYPSRDKRLRRAYFGK